MVASLGPKLAISLLCNVPATFWKDTWTICSCFTDTTGGICFKVELFDVSCGGLNRYCFCRLYVPLTTRRGRDCCSLWPAPVVCLLAASPSSWVCSFITVLFSTGGHEMETSLPNFRILIFPYRSIKYRGSDTTVEWSSCQSCSWNLVLLCLSQIFKWSLRHFSLLL